MDRREIHFQLSVQRKLWDHLEQLRWPKIMFVGYGELVLIIRQPVYHGKRTYGVANCSAQVTDVVNVRAIGEVSEEPIK